MRLYTRAEFIKLPAGTIYSRLSEPKIFDGLFFKESGPEMDTDWVEQDLISELKYPDGQYGPDGFEATAELIESFQDFETDLECAGRDGCFEDSDKFVVWDAKDVTKLIDKLTSSLRQ